MLPFTPTIRSLHSYSSDDASSDLSIMVTLIDSLNSPPAQVLHVLQPTSSTITYTVSTRSVPKTLPALAGYYAGILMRFLLGVTSALLLWLKWRVTQAQTSGLLLGALGHDAAERLVNLVEVCQRRYLIPSAFFILFLVFRRNYTGTSYSYLLLSLLLLN
jgi:phosphatidylinositol glycan class H protein